MYYSYDANGNRTRNNDSNGRFTDYKVAQSIQNKTPSPALLNKING